MVRLQVDAGCGLEGVEFQGSRSAVARLVHWAARSTLCSSACLCRSLFRCVFYYSGAASRAGLSYSGAILASRTGDWPASQVGGGRAVRRGPGAGRQRPPARPCTAHCVLASPSLWTTPAAHAAALLPCAPQAQEARQRIEQALDAAGIKTWELSNVRPATACLALWRGRACRPGLVPCGLRRPGAEAPTRRAHCAPSACLRLTCPLCHRRRWTTAGARARRWTRRSWRWPEARGSSGATQWICCGEEQQPVKFKLSAAQPPAQPQCNKGAALAPAASWAAEVAAL